MNNLTVEELNKLMLLVMEHRAKDKKNEKSNNELWNKLWEMKREIL